ncbi:hypothetical protein ACTXT7_006252 [Hymenolepis weldensis]
MSPEKRHTDEDQIDKLSFKVCRLTSELFDEDANLEAPTDMNRCHFLKATSEENSASSGYISGASNNLPFHGTVEFGKFVPKISGKSDSCSDDLNLINNTNKSKPYYRRSLSAESPPRKLAKSPDKPPSVLPIVKISTQGCDLISVHTVAQLGRGEYKKLNVTYTIIDCRYPYEYEAGHIKGAVNLYTSSDLVKEIFMNAPAASFDKDKILVDLGPQVEELLLGPNEDVQMPVVRNFKIAELSTDPELDKMLNELSKTRKSVDDEDVPIVPVPEANPNAAPSHVLIFHCEFSSQRGPELCRFLRRVDRLINYSRYPFLFYPYVYVMMGGYEAFYRKCPELCEPRGYLKMFKQENRDELLYYAKLAKEVSDVCTSCFKASQLFYLTIFPSMEEEEKENKLALRLVKTMLPGSQMQNTRELLESSFGNIEDVEVKPSVPGKEFTTRQRLQLVEHIIRKGRWVVDIYERNRYLSSEETSTDFSDISKIAERKVDPNFSSRLRPVTILNFHDDEYQPKSVLSFSDANNETLNSSRRL